MSLLLTLACGQHHEIDAQLWDPDIEVVGDRLYVMLPQGGALMTLSESSEPKLVDLDGASPNRLVPVPGGERVLVFSSWVVCQDPEIELERDCEEEDLGIDYELGILSAEGLDLSIDVPGHLDGVALSPDGAFAVLYLDGPPAGSSVDRVADLDSVFLIDLETGDSASVTVGFAPGNILFMPNGKAAMVLSRSSAVLVDLDELKVKVRYDLTLDADQEIDPTIAALTPDGNYGLVGISGEDLLYKIDLVDPSIDLEDLDGEPTALVVDEDCDCTVVAYKSRRQVDLLFHDGFTRSALETDERPETLVDGDGVVLAFDADGAGHDVYAIDLETQQITEYVVANRVSEAWVDPSGRYGVGLMMPETASWTDEVAAYADARYGLAVLELDDDEARNLVLEGVPLELGLIATEFTTYALVLLEDDDEALLIDLSEPQPPMIIEMAAPPLKLGTLGDGRFWIAHDSPLGAVTLIDPLSPGEQVVLEDFAAVGVFPDDTLARRTP
ncbi:MAG TPA: hypothetical protein QGF58_19740 [Myxococcota bacterium]|nr:hypothetical protein [Myxococcota bacterium]